jgi:rhamnose utilization protein RhaD (predicted bifunctional aldolase and dehydrogenase)
MNQNMKKIKESVITYCSEIGKDPLLVQGAGGNVSWKEGDTLWIKASGTWLAEASEKDIFVPVDLHHLRSAIGAGNFSVTPMLRGESKLRPSIETLLHALMPGEVVVHLHAIEILAHLVHENCQADFLSLLDQSIKWTMVNYHKPGPDLATAVCTALARNPLSNVIFLKNHGVVIGGTDIAEVKRILDTLTKNLNTLPVNNINNSLPASFNELFQGEYYQPVTDSEVHQLALNPDLFDRLATDWALYPDHVVFLGPHAYTYQSPEEFLIKHNAMPAKPELVFILGHGVFVKSTFNNAKHAQLRCFYDVLARQNPDSSLNALNNDQIAELLNWDAEQYRMSFAK